MRTQSSSQNDRKVEGERGLWRSSDPTPLLKQGHLELGAQDHVKIVSKHLQKYISLPQIMQEFAHLLHSMSKVHKI